MKTPSLLAQKKPKERIAVVDSCPASRIGLSHYIKKLNRWDIAWASASAEEAMEKMGKDKPDLLILEINLLGKDGLEFIKQLLPFYPNLKILVHSSHSEEFYAERCLRAGAMGYLHKMDPMGKLEEVVEKLLRGEFYVNPRIASQTLRSIVNHTDNGRSTSVHNLTDRELEILILMAQGDSCHDSAEKLHISPAGRCRFIAIICG